jgi:TRAP-type C4-dicarboxylate transport system permease small subunit
MNAAGTLWILALMVLINADVFGRALFNSPIAGVPEIVSLSIVGIVFLQITHTLRSGRFIRSDVLIARLAARFPRVGEAVEALHHVIGAALVAVIFVFTLRKLSRAWEIDEYIGTEGDFTAPVWPIFLIILIGCAGSFIQFLLLAWRHAAAAR